MQFLQLYSPIVIQEPYWCGNKLCVWGGMFYSSVIRLESFSESVLKAVNFTSTYQFCFVFPYVKQED